MKKWINRNREIEKCKKVRRKPTRIRVGAPKMGRAPIMGRYCVPACMTSQLCPRPTKVQAIASRRLNLKTPDLAHFVLHIYSTGSGFSCGFGGISRGYWGYFHSVFVFRGAYGGVS